MTANVCLPRSRANLLKVIADLNPAKDPEVQPGQIDGNPTPGITWCNKFAKKFCDAMGVHLPFKLANDQLVWLDSLEGAAQGWEACTRIDAALRAELGQPVLVGFFNASPPPHDHGHIAVVIPSAEGRLHIAQAGLRNFNDDLLERGFGGKPVKFWSHP